MVKNKLEATKNTQKILISISTLLLVGIIFFVTYNFTYGNTKSSYINSIYSQKLKIDEANKSVAQVVKNIDKLDVSNQQEIENIISVITKAESTVQGSINSLKKISPPANYKDHYSSFMEALSSNKKIFTQTNLILKNTKSKDLQKAIDALDKNIGDTTAAYENSKLGKAYIKLPGEILTLWDKVGNYALSAYSNFETKSALLDQYTEYYNSMDPIIEEFINEKQDLNDYITAIKDGNSSINDVYDEIDRKLGNLSRIKNSYSKLSSPSKTAKQHSHFNDILNSYFTYCEQFKPVLTQLQQAGGDTQALMNVNVSLEELYVKYQEITTFYNEYKGLYDNDKYTYTNIDNL